MTAPREPRTLTTAGELGAPKPRTPGKAWTGHVMERRYWLTKKGYVALAIAEQVERGKGVNS